ncbi:MAG: glycosyltransferase family 4 protein, partial [Actinobacteria bacterium]|nr:glycosyltransferase family 4 protein [Actinomycetota bacterium]
MSPGGWGVSPEKTAPGRVVFDLQATQSVDQRHRGIPRYVADLAYAIEHISPDAVGAFVVNPDLALPEPGVTDGLVAAGKLRRVDDIDWGDVGALHIASPLEMTRPGHRLLPPGARAAGVPLIVTFYDLIPQLMPQYYLEDPGLRRRYRARLQLVRLATAVLTLSESTRKDVIEHLGLDPRRVFVVGAGTSDRFRPPESRQAAAAEAMAAVPGLRAPFVFYIGSYERRKNLEPLLEAWALLPPEIRSRWQLAMCCPLKWSERHHLLWRAAGLRIVDSLCLTGFVTDEVLLRLHQGSDLFVFPSLYEGYGLPVAEALACGAPVLAADASSLPEILPPEFLFDATSPPPIAAAIERGLTDEAFRARLLAASGRPPTT